jgi:hypothetical protein
LKIYRAWLALAAILVVGSTPAYASGDSEPGNGVLVSLTGENFVATEVGSNVGTLVVEGECNLVGPSTFMFTATGTTVGPYPGPFVETGTFTIASPFGPATSFAASFSIDSPVGDVTGTKTSTGGLLTQGLCGDATGFDPAGANAVDFEGNVMYSATISTPGGTATDQGTSFVTVADTQVRALPDFQGFVFTETFASTQFIPGQCDGDDEQGDHGEQGDDDSQGDCDDDDQGEDED